MLILSLKKNTFFYPIVILDKDLLKKKRGLLGWTQRIVSPIFKNFYDLKFCFILEILIMLIKQISSYINLIDDKNLTTFSQVGPNNNNQIASNSPQIKYLTLNRDYPTATQNNKISLEKGNHISFELILQGTWQKGLIKFQFGAEIILFQYQTPTSFENFSIICDSYQAEIKTINFILQQSDSKIIKFTMSNDGMDRFQLEIYQYQKLNTIIYALNVLSVFMEYIWMAFGMNVLYIQYLYRNWMLIILQFQSTFFQISPQINFYLIKKGRQLFLSDQAIVEEQVKMELISDTYNTNQLPILMQYIGRSDLLGVLKNNQGTTRLINEVKNNIGTYLI
ncbi:unnamed protein product [Paramecium pentaurelia]|uniref:Transmembrane protein n=1 Tax=Paramecium pentaurelia TaxID=43138 RepID=A0A8S1Y944_9CILI|nr:unnamed protein product [Paramecium pentaurelia]